MDVIVAATSVLNLAEVLLNLPDIVRRGGDNVEKLRRIKTHVATVKAKFEDPTLPVSAEVKQRFCEHLQDASRILSSIREPLPCCRPRCGRVTEYLWYLFHGSIFANKIDDVDKLLGRLQMELVTDIWRGVEQIGQQVEQRLPAISTAIVPAIPFVETGLDRSRVILDFLDLIRVEPQPLAVGIYGQGGLGKTTILNKTLDVLSKENRFSKTVYVQVGENPTDKSLKKLQSYILKEMVGKTVEFPSLQHGQTALREAIQKLKSDQDLLCMAVDNIWEPEHLKKVLPDDLGSVFPSSSCILLTSRRLSVVDALEHLCGQGFKVFPHNPELLSNEASEEFFVKYASKNKPLGEEHLDMVREIVPLCGRLPLTLEVIGSIFAKESYREKKRWEEIKRGMELEVPTFPIDSREVSNAFEASYQHLRPATQEAFKIVVASLYGWRWTTVKSIVGEAEMRELEDSSLLNAVDGRRLKFVDYEYEYTSVITSDDMVVPRLLYVAMHDLIMKLGKHLIQKDRLVVGSSQESMEYLRIADDSALSKVKLLWLCKTIREDLGNEWEKISKLNSLLVFTLDGQDMCQSDECISRLLSCKALRCIHFMSINSSILINNQIKLSPELRELHFIFCRGMKEMPCSSNLYSKLERLHVVQCNFTRLANGTYDALRELSIITCHMITALPEKLGNLEMLLIKSCDRLTHVPPLSSLKKLEFLYICECHRLETLTAACDEPHPLRHLVARSNGCATRLSSGDSTGEPLPLFSNLTSLVSVSLEDDAELSELPEAVGSLNALRELRLCKYEKLGALPAAIVGGATSLQRLDLSDCEELLELPDEIGDLKKLETLILDGCFNLRKLPPSIGKAMSLQQLDLGGCEGLLELPNEIGDLKKLETLNLRGCINLQKLPPSIGKATSLQELDLCGCEGLLELPNEIEDLKKLETLILYCCRKLQKLPPSIGKATSLQRLDLSGCEWLLELLDEIGDLKRLDMRSCSSLQKLPPSIGNATSYKNWI